MRRIRSTAVAVGLLVGLAGSLFVAVDARADEEGYSTATGVWVEQDHQCADDDLEEGELEDGQRVPQLQGDVPADHQENGRAELGYNCGLSLVSRTRLNAVIEQDETEPKRRRRETGNGNMAWSGDCAYVAGSGAVFGDPTPNAVNGVAVVDVSDPESPVHVGTLTTRGSTSAMEALHAVDASDRSVLVVGEYGNQAEGPKPVDVYDVSDCADPVRLETIWFDENIHNLTISGNGRYVYATQPLQVADIEPLFASDRPPGLVCEGEPEEDRTYCAVELGNLEEAIPGAPVSHGPMADLDDPIEDVAWSQTQSNYLSHEAWPSEDGTKLYLGGQLPTWETITIVDIEEWLTGDGPPEVISQRQGRGHSVRTATIRDDAGEVESRLLLHSEESVIGPGWGCLTDEGNPFIGPAEPWLTDITDEANPGASLQFGLEINDPANCGAQMDSRTKAATHYHDVDDEDDTTFAMVSMWNAGLRLFDIRDPEGPEEVAYFNPGIVTVGEPGQEQKRLDHAWAHIRYRAETGHIWLATSSGGFWVLELNPQLRAHLGLDDRPGRRPAEPGRPDWSGRPEVSYPDGRPGTAGTAAATGSTVPMPVAVALEPSDAWYCTLSPAQATVPAAPSAPTSPLPALTG